MTPTPGARALVLTALVLLGGCAADLLSRDGHHLIEQGRYEEGLAKLREAVGSDAGNFQHRTRLQERSERAVFELLTRADADLAAGLEADAERGYQRALGIHPSSSRAAAGIAAVATARRNREDVQKAVALEGRGQVEAAVELLRKVIALNPGNAAAVNALAQLQARRFRERIATPQLRSSLTKPISLELRDIPLRQVFDALSRTSGINFTLDKDVRPDIRVSVSVRDVLIQTAIDLILDPNQLVGKIVNENTVLVYPATPQKQREYQDLVIRSFYLENADVKQAQSMVKTMLKVKDTFIDEKLNLLIIRDTPDVVRLAESLISVQDHADPEVVLEVEVLEVLRSRLMVLGVQVPQQLQIAPGQIIRPPYPYNLDIRSEKGDSNLLSNPRIRVRNREKAKVLIGNRIPVISSVVTPNATQPVITDNIQYLDVGLKLDVEPNIHMDGSVTIKMSMEVSTLGDSIISKNGTIAYRVGTRNASTVLQLKDGETQTLMGLIQDDEIERASRLPGLGDIPLVGRLFSNTRTDGQKTEIVLTITPRVVRNIPRPPLTVASLWSGTEAGFRSPRPLINEAEAPAKPAARSGAAPAAAPTAAPTAALTAAAQAPAPAPGAGAFEFSWKAPAEVKAGEQFVVTLDAASTVPLGMADLQLLFDPTMLSLVGVAEGEWMKRGGAATQFEDKSNAAAGRVVASIRRNAPEGATGSGQLIALTLKAVREGQTQMFVTSASPARTGGGAVPVRGSGPLQIRIRSAGK